VGNVLEVRLPPVEVSAPVRVTFIPATVPVQVVPEQERLTKVNEPSLITTEVDETLLPLVPTTPPKLVELK
jgi:hypothetical protein